MRVAQPTVEGVLLLTADALVAQYPERPLVGLSFAAQAPPDHSAVQPTDLGDSAERTSGPARL